jgi:hypothetical protein
MPSHNITKATTSGTFPRDHHTPDTFPPPDTGTGSNASTSYPQKNTFLYFLVKAIAVKP